MNQKLITAFVLCVFMLTACQPADPQPVFTPSAEATATPIPLPASAPTTAATLPGVIWSFAVSPDAAVIAFATSKGLELYDLKTFAPLRTLETGENVYSLSWSPDGTKLAAGVLAILPNPSEFTGSKAVLKVWDTSTWGVVMEPDFSNGLVDERILDIAWKPDGSALSISTDLNGVMVFDLASGKLTSQQTEFAGTVLQSAWSPDGSRLVSTGDMAYSLRRWKLGNGDSVRLFDQRASSSMEVAWTPDGKRIVSGHANGVICFWTAATNQCDGFIQAHRTAVFSMALSPDGSKLATGGGVIRIWDTQTGKLLTAFGLDDKFIYDHLGWVSPNQTLATLQTGLDNPEITTVRLWDISTGMPLAQFQGGKR
jgi:WD40 repeat protein